MQDSEAGREQGAERRRRDLVVVVCLWLVGSGVFWAYYRGDLAGRPAFWTDTYEYAQTARALLETGRLVTNSAQVLEFKLLYRGRLPLRYFYHDVGNTLLMALGFRLAGTSDRTIPLVSGLLFTLLPPLVFLLGRGLFDWRTGVLAAALTAGNPELLTFSATGLSEVPSAFFMTVLLGLLLLRSRSVRTLVLAGGIFGILVLLRSSFVACLPWILGFLCLPPEEGRPSSMRAGFEPKRLKAPAWFLAGAAIFVVPSTVRSYAASGRPFFAVASYYMPLFATDAIKGKSKTVDSIPGLEVSATRYFMGHPAALVRKAAYQTERLAQELLEGGLAVGDTWVLPMLSFLLLMSGLAPPADETSRQRRFRRLFLLLFLTPLAVGFVYQIRLRYLYPFLPVVLVYDAEVLCRLLPRGPGRAARTFVGFLVTAVLLSGLPKRLVFGRDEGIAEGRLRDEYLRTLGEFIRHKTPKDAVVLAPLLEVKPVAWYSRREIVEQSDYTFSVLSAETDRNRLFQLLTSGPGGKQVQGSARAGYHPIERWRSRIGEEAVLLEEDQVPKSIPPRGPLR